MKDARRNTSTRVIKLFSKDGETLNFIDRVEIDLQAIIPADEMIAGCPAYGVFYNGEIVKAISHPELGFIACLNL